jgi:hypothetical protein
MLANQRIHKLYFVYYCDFYISPIKENTSTSNKVSYQRSKKWNMNNLTVYETTQIPIWRATKVRTEYLYMMSGTSCLLKVNLTFRTFQDVHQLISPYQHSSDPGEEFSKLLHDTGFEVIDCQFRDSEYTFDTVSSFRGDCWIHINLTLKIIFTEAIPLCLLLNKTHLFSLTQHTFIQSFQLPTHIWYMFRPILRQYSGMSTQEHIQEDTIISKSPFFIFTVFVEQMA